MYEIFERLCAGKGVSAYKVAKETGVTTGTLSSWKMGRYVPKEEKMRKLADYFGVSVEYLKTGKDPEGYYENDETARIAQEIHDNTDLRGLFSAAQDASPQTIKTLYEILLTLKKQEENNES